MAIFGMKGTGDWVANEDPQNWRQGIMKLFPNSHATLVAITSMMSSQSINHKIHNWFTKTLQNQAGDVTNIYTDSSLSTAYVSGGTAGDILYVNVAEATASHFIADAQIVLRDNSALDVDCTAKVISVVRNGASSYLKVSLLEDDDNGASNDLSDADRVIRLQSIHEEGTGAPTAHTYQPVQYSNNMQIFKSAVEETGSAMATRLRTGDPFAEDQREGLLYHGMGLEESFIFGVKTSNTGSGGKPEYSMDGIIPFLRTNYSTGESDFRTTHSGKSWKEKGEEFIDDTLETYSEWVGDGSEILCLAGSGAINGLNKIAKQSASINVNPKSMDYGMKLQEWTNPFDIPLFLKSYWHFTKEANSYKNSMLFVKPDNLRYTYMEGRDTSIKENVQSNDADGRKDQWLTECTMEILHPEQFLLVHGVGLDG